MSLHPPLLADRERLLDTFTRLAKIDLAVTSRRCSAQLLVAEFSE